MTTWQEIHYRATQNPVGFEVVVRMIQDWQDYAGEYLERYGDPISTDGVLGEAWADIGKALLTLLNGDLGRLDGGILDSAITNTFLEQGFSDNGEDVVQEVGRHGLTYVHRRNTGYCQICEGDCEYDEDGNYIVP